MENEPRSCSIQSDNFDSPKCLNFRTHLGLNKAATREKLLGPMIKTSAFAIWAQSETASLPKCTECLALELKMSKSDLVQGFSRTLKKWMSAAGSTASTCSTTLKYSSSAAHRACQITGGYLVLLGVMSPRRRWTATWYFVSGLKCMAGTDQIPDCARKRERKSGVITELEANSRTRVVAPTSSNKVPLIFERLPTWLPYSASPWRHVLNLGGVAVTRSRYSSPIKVLIVLKSLSFVRCKWWWIRPPKPMELLKAVAMNKIKLPSVWPRPSSRSMAYMMVALLSKHSRPHFLADTLTLDVGVFLLICLARSPFLGLPTSSSHSMFGKV